MSITNFTKIHDKLTMEVPELLAEEHLVSKKDAFPSNTSSHEAEAWPDKMWQQTSALIAECLQGQAWMCVLICSLCVAVLAAHPPPPQKAGGGGRRVCLLLHLPLGADRVVRTLACIPTPWL